MTTQKKTNSKFWTNLLLIAVLAAGAGAYLLQNSEPVSEERKLEELRDRNYANVANASQEVKAAWPQSIDELMTEFWQAGSQKNYDRMMELCPGSTREDFSSHYDNFTPSPAKAIGAPQPHPQDPNVRMVPVKVPFPFYPEKTVKMAVFTMEDGRLAIDGEKTIWW